MKIIKPSVEFFGSVPTDYENTIRFIEKAGRTCYKSEDKITDDSAEKFVKKLINAGHLAMIEHSNFVIRTERYCSIDDLKISAGKYLNVLDAGEYMYVGGNLTAWFNQINDFAYDFAYNPFLSTYGKLFNLHEPSYESGENTWQVCPHDQIPPELHRYSAKFICDRGVSHEIVRHRPCSFAQESTRYVNYGGKDMEFIEPTGFEAWPDEAYQQFVLSCEEAEDAYNTLISVGLKPQQARAVLPNALKTEIIVTADAAEWNHIRTLRTSKAAHPDMQRIMNMLPWREFL